MHRPLLQLTNFLLHGKSHSNDSLEVFLLDKCERCVASVALTRAV